VKIVAHFKKYDVLWRVLSFEFVVLVLATLSVRQPLAEGFATFFATRPLLMPLLLTSWALGIVFMWMLSVVLKRVLFDACKAVWIEGESIVYIHRWNMFIARSRVSQICLGTYGRFERHGVILTLRDGTRRVIPTGSLRENESEILATLQKAMLDTGAYRSQSSPERQTTCCALRES